MKYPLSSHPFRIYVVLLLTLISTCLSAIAEISLGPIGGKFEPRESTYYLKVTSLTTGAPGEQGGLLVGDFIYGAFGKDFGIFSSEKNDGWKGSVQDLGEAIDQAESGNGTLPLTVLRMGVGKMDLNIQLQAVGGFGPSYPLGSQKFDTMYQWSCEQIHSKVTASSTGGFAYNSGLFGLVLLSHPHWNDTTGEKPYRLSINKIRDYCVGFLESRILTPVESTNMDGTPNDGSAADSDPNDQSHVDAGLENWEICSATMFLAEYRKKTLDTSVTDSSLQLAADLLANRVQTHAQPPAGDGTPPPAADARLGMMGHTGIVADYSHYYWTGLNIMNAHALTALSMLKGTSASVDDFKFQSCWAYMRTATRLDGGEEDGNVGYAHWTQSGGDSSGRTAGAIFGLSQYGGLSASDQDILQRQKNYIVRQWQRMQHSHAYTVGGVFLYQFAMPYLADRQQRFIMENQRYFYQFHRNSSGTLEYFGGRWNNGGDGYLNFDNVALINIAMAQAVQSGNLPSFPATNTARIHADFKSPRVTWPTIDARLITTNSNSVDFNIDITDYLGAVLNDGDYSLSWSHISGPTTATFSATSGGITTGSFPSNGTYRIQLEVIKGGYTLTEPIDVAVFSAAPAGYVVGRVNYQVYKNITGADIVDLTGHANYPNSPDTIGTLTTLEGTYSGSDYGSRIQGYIIPQVSGDYNFYIASDDASEFKFGADESSAVKICDLATYSSKYEWTKFPSQRSSVQTLTAGTPYFFEVNHKEGYGSDHLAVAWTLPGVSTPTVIDSYYLALPEGVGALSIVSHPIDQTAAKGEDTTFDVQVTGKGPFFYQWTLDGVSYWPASTNSELLLSNISAGVAGTYRCQITSASGSITSDSAILTVTGVTDIVAGGLWRELYEGINGSAVADLVTSEAYPKFPDSGGVIATTEAPSDSGDNYGQRWTGWLIPDISGLHTFYITSDDSSEIWLSTDENEYNKVKIAAKNGYCSPKYWSGGAKSSDIDLVAGVRYYIEVRHKEARDGDHCSVTWRRPGDPVPTNGVGSIPSPNLEYRVGGVHVKTIVINLALANPTTNKVHIRPGLGLDMEVIATPAPDINDSIVWSMESGAGIVTFEQPNSLTTGATFSSEGTYVLRCTVDNGGIPSTTDVHVTVSSNALPTWISTSVSEPTQGSGTLNPDGSITILGSGSNIYGTSDEFQFYNQNMTGDFDIRSQVVSKTIDGSSGTHAQLMARESTAANARNIGVTHEGTDGVAFQYRETTGASTEWKSISNLQLPVWIRLVRSGGNPTTGSAGQTFTGYYSVDGGVTWIQRDTYTYTTPMPESLMVGFAVSSAGNTLNTVVYDNVSGFPTSQNYGVVVDAGVNGTLDINSVANLASTVTDDSKPLIPGIITTTWTKVSGPGIVTFGDVSATVTTASFQYVGEYILRLYATDGEVTTYDEVTLDVTGNPDGDEDGLPDDWEMAHFGDLSTSDGSGDVDSDGLSDAAELTAGTDPTNNDDDGDGYWDGLEINVGTDPLDNTSKPTLSTHLAHHWKLDDGSGTNVADEASVNISNGVTNSTTWNSCHGTGNLTLDGLTEKVDIPSSASITGTGDLGISLWVKNTSATIATFVQQRNDGGPAGIKGEYMLTQDTDGTVRFMIYNGGHQFNFSTTTTVNDGAWHHIMAVRIGKKGYIYIDGELEAEATGAVKSLNPLLVAIGYDRRDNNKYYQGQLDDVRLYNRGLVPADATLMMANQAPVPATITPSVFEDVLAGSVVTTVPMSDANASDLHCFEITSGNVGGLFAIDDNGQITTTGALDYETTTQYTLTVTVTDNGTPALSDTTTITVNINDIVVSDDSDENSLNDNWEITHYGSLAVAIPSADSDGDGLTTYQEMVFGSNPTVNESNAVPVQSVIVDDAGTAKLQFKFRRPQNHANLNVTYQFQTCDDLKIASWVDNAAVSTVTQDGSNEWVTYLIPLPSGANTRIFCRCHVTPNP